MNFNNILFLDIETVAQAESYDHLDDDWKALWDAKAALLLRNKEGETAETIYERAGIYAEFGKIVCISCGCLQGAKEDRKLVIKSFGGDDEKTLLREFADMLQKWSGDADKFLCAHNGKEFDYPYLCRRMVINGVTIPEALKISGKKPWDIRHLDTMEMWKFGDYKSYTTLKLLAKVFGVPSPKDDIDGSMVNDVYWIEKDIDRIVHYCQKDVVTLTQILLRFHCEPLIKPENIAIKYVQPG
ncbi:MAG TPA: 3'-5' exonuclease [Flavisolibacter sp.]|nr:3'-5' exonuclease [Flavisolibacter sp.]